MQNNNHSYEGMIIKAVGGFYYVETAEGLLECKARGIFRKKGISPSVGDRVTLSVPENGYPFIEEIKERKNILVRPPIANLDLLFIVTSVTDPSPNLFVIDKMTAVAVKKNIEPIIVVTKSDLGDYRPLEEIYRTAGFKVIPYSIYESKNTTAIHNLLKGHLSAFIGNTGVGKSSLLNTILPELNIKTGEISQKLGRGRHTTRHSELFHVDGGYVADTPGFSTVDVERYELIRSVELADCFPEFEDYLNQCRFTSCTHVCEQGCAVLSAVQEGKIMPSRHNSYKSMYEEAKAIKDWQIKT
ncbi:MAG: ribosome small subunit-dependent GTPase A [Acutalibacteraceae bacterium]